MSAADSELSRWPDLATASIRVHSSRSTVAHRSSSAIEGAASRRSVALGGGLGSGTGLRCATSARLASAALAGMLPTSRGYADARTEAGRRLRPNSGLDESSHDHACPQTHAAMERLIWTGLIC